MNNWIDIMMKTAGVKKRVDTLPLWEKVAFRYPLFTPEKQLKIIKLLARNSAFITIDTGIKAGNIHFSCVKNNTLYEGEDAVICQALAQLTTKLMMAEELDKEKVKEILEG